MVRVIVGLYIVIMFCAFDVQAVKAKTHHHKAFASSIEASNDTIADNMNYSVSSGNKQQLITTGEIRHVSSKILDEQRQLFVHLPKNYFHESAKDRRYPVVYLLDAEFSFNSFVTMVDLLSGSFGYQNGIPELIVIGIRNTDRTKDLTPTKSSLLHPKNENQLLFPTSGGGRNFLQFIKKELKPYVKENFRAEDYAILVGHSFGGLFAIDVFLNDPESFDAYVAQDPSLWWEGGQMIKHTKEKLMEDRIYDKKIFVSQADTAKRSITPLFDMWHPIQEFKSMIEPRLKDNFKFQTYDDEFHGTIFYKGNYDAMRFLFHGFERAQKVSR